MPIERETIRGGLLRKGEKNPEAGRFVEGGSDHDFYRLEINGKRCAVRTMLSRGTQYKDYSDELVKSVYKQLGLNKKELHDLLECQLTMEDYLKLLKERGRIT